VRFEFTELTDAELQLQSDVRAFLADELPRGTFEPALGMGAGPNREFSKRVASRGWVGMALPIEYGGHDRSPVERFVVIEEMLRWGAPIGYHKFADRQTGPLIVRLGTEEQKREFLPEICAAELSFCLGMSEPDAGSDLSSVATRAFEAPGGWRVNGTKIWTTGAHYSEFMMALVRTSIEPNRHSGLTQMIIDLRSRGVTISRIPFLDGTAEFNEVVFDDVFVPASRVLGEVGNGWAQIGSELALERGGPDRWLSTYLLVEQFLREHRSSELDAADLEFIGSAVARWWGLRQMSLSIARLVERGVEPAAEAALVKELGTRFEQDLIDGVRRLIAAEPSLGSASQLERLFARAILVSPSFTIRGGTIEILRSIASQAFRRRA
jgi:hypothetical protein